MYENLKQILNGESGVYIIAEVAQNHDGSLGQAHAFIDAVARTGANAIKFQTHIAEAESTPDEPFRVNFSYEDKTRYDYWKRMEFTEEQWRGLYLHAKEEKLDFLSSPFSIEAFHLLQRVGVEVWKFGSGEVFNSPLMKEVLRTDDIILISSGLSTFQDLDLGVKEIRNAGNSFGIFQCTTQYPSNAKTIGLNVVSEMIKRYECVVGLSDHSGTIYPSFGAVVLGAKIIETHVTFSKEMFGPDVKASLTMEQLKMLVEGTRVLEEIINNPIDKNLETKEIQDLKRIFSKSIYAKRNLKKGEILDNNMLCFKKPNNGIPVADLKDVLGKKLAKDVRKDTTLQWADIM